MGGLAALIRNRTNFAEAELTVESDGHLDVLDRQDRYDRWNTLDLVHGVALYFVTTHTIDSSETLADQSNVGYCPGPDFRFGLCSLPCRRLAVFRPGRYS